MLKFTTFLAVLGSFLIQVGNLNSKTINFVFNMANTTKLHILSLMKNLTLSMGGGGQYWVNFGGKINRFLSAATRIGM